jgi:hypothetical protein
MLFILLFGFRISKLQRNFGHIAGVVLRGEKVATDDDAEFVGETGEGILANE